MECPALIKGYHTDGIDVKLSARKTRPKKPWDKRCCWKKYFLLDYPFKDKERRWAYSDIPLPRGEYQLVSLQICLFLLYTFYMTLPNTAPVPSWSKERLDEIVALLQKNHNLDIQPFAETFLVQSLERRMAARSINSAATYTRHLVGDGAVCHNSDDVF